MTDNHRIDRLAAETRRLNARAFGIALVVLLAISTLMLILTVVIQARQQTSLCRTTNALRTSIRASIERQRGNLPKLTYFRSHPAELLQQQAEIARELTSFADRPC